MPRGGPSIDGTGESVHKMTAAGHMIDDPLSLKCSPLEAMDWASGVRRNPLPVGSPGRSAVLLRHELLDAPLPRFCGKTMPPGVLWAGGHGPIQVASRSSCSKSAGGVGFGLGSGCGARRGVA